MKMWIVDRRIIFLFFLAVANIAFAQYPQPAFTKFGVKDGLPSSEVYCALQDREGYMWFGTDRGVARYDGYKFKTYTMDDGLSDDVIFGMFEDSKGKIWMHGIAGTLCFWENGSFRNYPYNDKILANNPGVKYYNSFYVDSSETVFIGTVNHGLIKISSNGDCTIQKPILGEFVMEPYEGKVVSYGQVAHDFRLFYGKKKVLQKRVFDHGLRRNGVLLGNGLLVFNMTGSLYLYDINREQILDTISFNDRITNLSMIGHQVVFGVEQQGLKIYQINDKKFVERLAILKNMTSGMPTKDRNGGYWFPTMKGLFYTPDLGILSYTTSNGLHDNQVQELMLDNHELLIGFGPSMQRLTESGEFTNSEITVPTKLRNYLFDENSEYFSIQDSIVFFDNIKVYNIKGDFIYPNLNQRGIAHCSKHGQHVILVTRAAWVQLNLKSRKKKSLGITRIGGFISAVQVIDTSSLWLGTLGGLIKHTIDSTILMSEKDSLFSYRVVDLAQTENYGLLVATRGAGVLSYKDGRVLQIDKSKGLITNGISSIYADSIGNVWVATNSGLHKIHYQNPTEIDYFSIEDGLASNEITDVAQLNGNIYVATKQGLTIINEKVYEQFSSPLKVHISSILVDDIPINETVDRIDIDRDNYNFRLKFLTFYYRARKSIEFRYRFKGWNDHWEYTTKPEFRLSTFPQTGDYRLELQARIYPLGEWDGPVTKLRVVFHPPFYHTWWFRISMLMLAIILIYVGFKVDLLAYNKHIQQEIVNRLLRSLGKQTYLIVRINKEQVRINEARVRFVQAFKDYVEINTADKKYVYRSTMKNMESMVTPTKFIRVHRSYLVQKNKIDSVGKDYIIVSGTKIPIGVTYLESISELTSQFSRLNS